MFNLNIFGNSNNAELQAIRQERLEVNRRLSENREIISNIHEYYQGVESSRNIKRVRGSTSLRVRKVTTKDEYNDMFERLFGKE